MKVTYISVFILGLTYLEVKGRAMNISNVWFLPQEGFPVFYRYFNDKVTWNEAEAICGFHHADLLSVQTSTRMDSSRAYLKEIDVTDNIWIGLQKESPDKPFSWTDGEKLLEDGYWLEPVPKTNEKLCAAIDPVSDFRWNSFYCRGPQVASFVCELPVPDWAKKEDGCMITSLPSLTVTFIPEMGIIQLLSDCGLDGTRRIACKGGVNREEIIKRLACDEDAFVSTIVSKTTTDTVKEMNTEESARTNEVKPIQRDVTTKDLKSLETYLPQTRHKRDTNSSSTIMVQVEANSTPETSTHVTSTQKVNVLNLPSHVFPHSPYSASERNALSTKSPTPTENLPTTNQHKIATTKMMQDVVSSSTSKSTTTDARPKLMSTHKTISNEMTTKSSDETLHDLTNLKKKNVSNQGTRPTMPSVRNAVPVLIITGESYNETTPSNSTTSENPQVVFMIDEKEGFPEPYLVPVGEDVIISNPSLSPMEVIDVDVVELDNVTTTKTTSQSTAKVETSQISPSSETPSKSPHGIHPLRIGEKIIAETVTSTTVSTPDTETNITASSTRVNATTTTTTTTKTTLTTTTTTTTVKPHITVGATDNVEQLSQNVVEQENRGESVEIPQRPNRGRLLTHSSHPSFYPYFLNRVLG